MAFHGGLYVSRSSRFNGRSAGCGGLTNALHSSPPASHQLGPLDNGR